MFEVDPADHEKYNGDPNQPHQLHIITRIKCTRRRPYWEKKIVHDLGLDKVNYILHVVSCVCSLYHGLWFVAKEDFWIKFIAI